MPRQDLIQVRRDTAANWTSTNPVLAAGEIGFEKNTNKIKIGDGTKTWSLLSYTGEFLVSETLTATGDLLTRNNTGITKLPIGTTNGAFLVVDSTASTGMAWSVVKTDILSPFLLMGA